jgi:hypothetical protein
VPDGLIEDEALAHVQHDDLVASALFPQGFRQGQTHHRAEAPAEIIAFPQCLGLLGVEEKVLAPGDDLGELAIDGAFRVEAQVLGPVPEAAERLTDVGAELVELRVGKPGGGDDVAAPPSRGRRSLFRSCR